MFYSHFGLFLVTQSLESTLYINLCFSPVWWHYKRIRYKYNHFNRLLFPHLHRSNLFVTLQNTENTLIEMYIHQLQLYQTLLQPTHHQHPTKIANFHSCKKEEEKKAFNSKTKCHHMMPCLQIPQNTVIPFHCGSLSFMNASRNKLITTLKILVTFLILQSIHFL